MTEKEIINKIKHILEELSYPSAVAYLTLNDKKWLKATIKALEQEPCEDVISRQVAIDAFERFIHELGIKDEPYNYGEMALSVRNVPPVTPQPKTGHWIRWYEQKETEWCIENIPHCKCSECDKEYDPHSSQFIKYCNECGAKMQEVEE